MLFAAALCAAFVTLLAARPRTGVLAALLVRPSLDVWAEHRVASVGGAALNPASVLAVLIIAVGGAFLVERFRDARSAPAFLPFLAFALIASLGIPVASSRGGAVTEWLRLVSVLVLYGLAYVTVRTRRDVGVLAAVLLGSAVVPILVADYQTAQHAGRTIGEFDRAIGTFVQPDAFGIFLTVALCLATALFPARGVGWRVLLWAAAPFALVALVGSYTRTAWVAYAFALLVLGLVRYRSLLVVGPLLALALTVAVPSTVHRFNDLSRGPTAYGAGNSFATRVDLWKQNLPKIERNPVIGIGFKSIVTESTDAAHVHSDYVRAAVETGVPGLIAFVWMLLASAWGCWRAYRRCRRARDPMLTAIALGGFVASAAYIVMSGDSNLMTQIAVAGTAWGVMAASHAAGRLACETSPR